MNTKAKVSIDKAGRIILPKPFRDKLRLHPGDHLTLEADHATITLRPIWPEPLLKKELGVWVYQGEVEPATSDDSIPDLIDRVRLQRIRDILG